MSSSSSSDKKEEQFHILPIKGNEPPQLGGGLNSNPEYEAHKAKGPFIPNQEQLSSLEAPKSREELKKRSAELNK